MDYLALLRFLMAQLPHFMMPRFLCQMTALPRTVTGKLQRVSVKNTALSLELWDRKREGVNLRDLMDRPNAAEDARPAV